MKFNSGIERPSIHPSVHPFIQQMSTCYVPGTVLATGDEPRYGT